MLIYIYIYLCLAADVLGRGGEREISEGLRDCVYVCVGVSACVWMRERVSK